ncbi:MULTISPECIES: molecular chaperone [Serratia]|jgi:fimbrial chaperone protein|uniref:Molecular chaperone n=1 Tax=Serratia fonticola TaxID=47917 RepID=A0AAJ1YAI5_SERFO|nr:MULTISPECIES: molecular chaperone [Serratia]MBE0151701.1 molecular chaperone [Serratia fonticola]MDQ7210054.1 molecular chaperone [Serratia fonticola]MDQ9126046.1 molecular chaperone [Serratia fonticola]OKP23719.1 molecular chaperone [Serratia fonticola]CAI2159849.1 Chaperone protein fimC precursor [Serratia fonticola]
MAYTTRTFSCWAALLFSLTLLIVDSAAASVTMLGNRVIYPAQAREKTLQFTNDDAAPALIQVWLDIDNDKSTPETADAPFIASPQIFRMNAHSGQMVRLMYTGKGLPTDRESLFHLNFLQVPAVKQSETDKNKLVLLVSNRLKVFYRPEGLPGEGNQAGKQLRIQRNGNALQVSNPTPYYVSISYAKSGNKNLHIEPADMIAPFSQVSWPLGSAFPKGKLKVVLGVMNDYGVEVPVTLETLH